MAVKTFGRVLILALLCVCAWADDRYNMPDVEVHAFQPKGFRATIPDSTNLTYFIVQGLLTKNGASEKIDVAGETGDKIPIGDKSYWVVDLPDLKLEAGDIIDYLAFVAIGNAGYIKDNLKFEVKALDAFVTLPPSTIFSPENVTEATTKD